MAIQTSCPHCKAKFTAHNAWLASIAFDAHECEKHQPVIFPVCPLLQSNANGEQRNIDRISTMEIFAKVKQDAQQPATVDKLGGSYFDDELWQHLEGRVKYMLNAAGLR